MRRFLSKLRTYFTHFLKQDIDTIKFLQAKQLIMLQRQFSTQNIHEAEFKVFSQWGEDGIIQWIISKIPSIPPSFIEFGVEDYQESNTRFLLLNNNWKGLIIDGSEENMAKVKSAPFYWRTDLNPIAAFITRDNINDIFIKNGFSGGGD